MHELEEGNAWVKWRAKCRADHQSPIIAERVAMGWMDGNVDVDFPARTRQILLNYEQHEIVHTS